MRDRYREALLSMLGKVGFLFGGGLGIYVTSHLGDVYWWSARPLWFHLMPLVGGPLGGFAAFYFGARYLLSGIPSTDEPSPGEPENRASRASH